MGRKNIAQDLGKWLKGMKRDRYQRPGVNGASGPRRHRYCEFSEVREQCFPNSLGLLTILAYPVVDCPSDWCTGLITALVGI